jgi:hypothetical protein
MTACFYTYWLELPVWLAEALDGELVEEDEEATLGFI